jgi:pimeloyl-ACP methyl ester carboxylesterase
MDKKSINIQGLKIAYHDNEVNGRPILFIHGNSLSADTFEKQFTHETLSSKYRLIAPDLPGHGDSEFAPEPENDYSMEGFLGFLVNFIKILDLKEAVLVGHSLGGHMLIDAWEKIGNRASGLVIFGAPPFMIPPEMEHSHYEHPSFSLAFKPDLSDQEMQELAKAFVKMNEPIPPVILESIRNTDQMMRPSLGASVTPENIRNEAEIISNIKKPVAVIHGKNDQLLKHTYFERLNIPELWREKAQLVEGAGHCPQVENPQNFNQLLLDFLKEKIER